VGLHPDVASSFENVQRSSANVWCSDFQSSSIPTASDIFRNSGSLNKFWSILDLYSSLHPEVSSIADFQAYHIALTVFASCDCDTEPFL
jgi:hypothetical protein